MRTETERTGKKIAFGTTQHLRDALVAKMDTIPEYHCAKDFMQQCIDSFDNRKKVSENLEIPMGEHFISRRPYIVSAHQAAFFQSEDAKEMFKEKNLQENFLGQLIKML